LITGVGFIVTVIAYPVLAHPVVLLDTVKVALYVFVAAPPGMVMVIGLAGSTALITSTYPCASAAALKSMLYLSGALVVAE
jgi:hypothetical protein